MQSITKSEIDILVKLQAIETESNRIHAMLEGVSEKISDLDQELAGFANRISAEQSQLEGLSVPRIGC